MHLVVAEPATLRLISPMHFPRYYLGITLIAAALCLSQCRDSHETSAPVAVIPEDSRILVDDASYLRVEGDSHALSFQWWEHTEGADRKRATAVIERLQPMAQAQPQHFPPQLRFHEQSFQESDVSFFLSTGYLARKRLFFQRMRCDQPGSLHGKATLFPTGDVETKSITQQGPHRSRLWLLPFEAEVVVKQGALVIEGEGELLLLWHLPARDDADSPTWQDLVREFDPDGGDHPDLSKIADALAEEAVREAK